MMPETLQEVKLELVEALSQIIEIQEECIDELFRLLAQHMEAEELNKLPILDRINEAAMIRAEARV